MLEAVVICLDNSDWSRNRDCPPSRLQAQQEAAVTLANTKLQANAENSIGLLTLGGEHVRVCASPCGDMTTFHEAIQTLDGADGEADLLKGIQTAQLALKHRLNRNQRQRIILFVCSPLRTELRPDLERVGKVLKKNNVAIDVISFGEVQRNSELLKTLFTAVNANDTSHLLELESPVQSLSRAVVGSAIGGGAAGADEFGMDVDPSADPELLMALRLSLEEERARQQQEAAAAGGHMRTGDQLAGAGPDLGNRVISQGDSCGEVINEDRPPTAEEIMHLNIDEDLRQALLLSLQSMVEESGSAPPAAAGAPADTSMAEPAAPPATEPVEARSESDRYNTPPENTSYESISSEEPRLTAAEMKQLAELLPTVDVNNEEIIRAFRDLQRMEEERKQPPPS